jgi:hypothetical protein
VCIAGWKAHKCVVANLWVYTKLKPTGASIPDIPAWEMTVSPETETASLDKELEFFNQHWREWLRTQPSKFVVIGGTTVAGFHENYESAFEAGINKFGDKEFLVKQICTEEPVYLIF